MSANNMRMFGGAAVAAAALATMTVFPAGKSPYPAQAPVVPAKAPVVAVSAPPAPAPAPTPTSAPVPVSVPVPVPTRVPAPAPAPAVVKATREVGSDAEYKVGSVHYTVDRDNNVVIDPAVYTRIDLEFMKQDKYKAFQEGNALHDTLLRPELLEKYEVYAKNDGDEILCVVHFGSKINGHPTIVHGGITSLVFDNSFGWLFFSIDLPMAVTANLNVNYRQPLPMNTTCILRSKLNKLEGRKMFMAASLHDLNGKMIADSSSLFIALRPLQAAAARVQMNIASYGK